MSSAVTVPLGWDVGIEIPAALARRSAACKVEQRIDFRFVRVPAQPLAPPMDNAVYDRGGRRIHPSHRSGYLLDEYS